MVVEAAEAAEVTTLVAGLATTLVAALAVTALAQWEVS
jgi:hypothetical protein